MKLMELDFRGGMALLKRLLNNGFPDIEVVHTTPAFMSKQVIVFRAEATIDVPTRLEDLYEFSLGGPANAPVLVESSEPLIPKFGTLIPINPGQLHMAVSSQPVREYIPIFVNKNFLSELTYQAWGKKTVFFPNKKYPIPESTRWLAHEFMEEVANASASDSQRLSCLNYELTYNLLRSVAPGASSKAFRIEQQVVHTVEAYLRESYPDQVSLDELANLVNYSPYHLIRLFKQTTGLTPMAYLMHIRIEQAIKLLKNSKHTVSDISQLCGFGSHSHFTSTFRRTTGYSPSAYRKLL